MSTRHECHVLAFGDEVCIRSVRNIPNMFPKITFLGFFPQEKGIRLHLKRMKRLLSGDPIFLARWENSRFANTLRLELKSTDYDLIHLDGLPMVQYLNLCDSNPSIISTVDAVSLAHLRASKVNNNIIRKLAYRTNSILIRRIERRCLTSATKVHVFSPVDREYLSNVNPGIDVEYIEISIPEELVDYQTPQDKGNKGKNLQILFTGALGAESIAVGLKWFLKNIFEDVLRTHPYIDLLVLGQGANSSLRKTINEYKNTRYTEWVNDYYSELINSDVVVFPDPTGTGLKNRVFQAMALARPTVGTSSSFEGMQIGDGIHCLVRDSADEFLDALILLLEDDELRTRIGKSAREFILTRYSMDAIGSRWESLYKKTTEEFHR